MKIEELGELKVSRPIRLMLKTEFLKFRSTIIKTI